MKKKLFTLLVAGSLVVGTSVSAFAAPKDDVISALKGANVPAEYVTKAENYLKTHTITDAQAKGVIDQVNAASDIAKKENVTDLTKLSPAGKTAVLNAVNAAAKEIGLTVNFAKNAAGQYVATFQDNKGQTVLASTANEAQVKKTGSDSFVLVFGTMMIVLAGTSLIVTKRKVTA